MQQTDAEARIAVMFKVLKASIVLRDARLAALGLRPKVQDPGSVTVLNKCEPDKLETGK